MFSPLKRILTAGAAATRTGPARARQAVIAVLFTLLTAGLVAPAAVAGAVRPVAAPEATASPQATSCTGVWVVVDYGTAGGGTTTACATEHGTGLEALRSAGFTATLEKNLVTKIAGKPAKPDMAKAYWSYWTASRQADGSYSAWGYAQMGPDASQPKPGDAEGWRYVSLADDPAPPPGATPPAASTTAPAENGTAAPSPSVQPSPGDAGTGSPAGTIVVVSVVVAVAAAVGGWWLWKRRRP